MGFDGEGLAAAIAAHGPVVRVVVADIAGSTPREVGAAMLVWPDGMAGTIGGGALEWEALRAARAMLAAGEPTRVTEHPLGPALGQCCGGFVRLVLERFAAAPTLEGPLFARPMAEGAGPPPLGVERALRAARGGQPVAPFLSEGWMVEPLGPAPEPLWLYGAGHVGRAIVDTLAHLPVQITWIDDAKARFPDRVPDHASALIAANPADAVAHAPDRALHLVLTYSHALDLEICHRVLGRPFEMLGLIGSATKKARFLTRLAALGHSPAVLARLTCPIGNRALGKTPGAIAVGVAHQLLTRDARKAARGEGAQAAHGDLG